jgi:hypothetical protein
MKHLNLKLKEIRLILDVVFALVAVRIVIL